MIVFPTVKRKLSMGSLGIVVLTKYFIDKSYFRLFFDIVRNIIA